MTQRIPRVWHLENMRAKTPRWLAKDGYVTAYCGMVFLPNVAASSSDDCVECTRHLKGIILREFGPDPYEALHRKPRVTSAVEKPYPRPEED